MTENTQNENVVNDIITLIDEEDNSLDFKLVDVMEQTDFTKVEWNELAESTLNKYHFI